MIKRIYRDFKELPFETQGGLVLLVSLFVIVAYVVITAPVPGVK